MNKTKKKVSNNVYLEILEEHTDPVQERWTAKPINSGNKSIASDTHILVAVPRQEGFEESDNAARVYPAPHNTSKTFRTKDLKAKLDKFPHVDIFKEEFRECDACNTYGVVDFEFEFEGEGYNTEAECPVCEGEGQVSFSTDIPTGHKKFDSSKQFQIGNSLFTPDMVSKLLAIAEKLDEAEITLVHQTDAHKPSMFVVGDADVILASYMPYHAHDVAEQLAS